MSAYAELSHAQRELMDYVNRNGEPPYPREHMETRYRLLCQRVRESKRDVNTEAAADAAADAEWEARNG